MVIVYNINHVGLYIYLGYIKSIIIFLCRFKIIITIAVLCVVSYGFACSLIYQQ